jgi:hypothetical protein
MGWNDSGFSRRRAESASSSGFSPRDSGGKAMVKGPVSGLLAVAVKDFAKERGRTLTDVLRSMGLGSSTWCRMQYHAPITQATALKIVKYMGTDLRSVLRKYHRSE